MAHTNVNFISTKKLNKVASMEKGGSGRPPSTLTGNLRND